MLKPTLHVGLYNDPLPALKGETCAFMGKGTLHALLNIHAYLYIAYVGTHSCSLAHYMHEVTFMLYPTLHGLIFIHG